MDSSQTPNPVPWSAPTEPPPSGWNPRKALGPLGVVLVALFKFKGFLIAGLKFLPLLFKTGGSMILCIGLYAINWGWKFALGFVLLIFIHECGHLIAARRLGLKVGAPVFIPFMGAVIALKEAPRNAWIEAQIGLGGPLLGALGALLCYPIYLMTRDPLYMALAYSGFFINLFNLAPIGVLDGGRIVTAISPWLWVIGVVIIGVMMVLHFNFLLLLILGLGIGRLFTLFRSRSDEERRYFEVTAAQRWVISLLYFGLAAFLALGMKLMYIEV